MTLDQAIEAEAQAQAIACKPPISVAHTKPSLQRDTPRFAGN